MRQIRSAFFCLVIAICTTWSLTGLCQQMVNVAIVVSVPSVTISGNEMRLLDDADKELFKADRIQISMKSNRLLINGKQVDAPLRLMSENAITVGNKKLRGELDVLMERGGITLVHPLELEEYVAGIVAAEMPKAWPLEALKAQAIASRTYALFQKYKRIDQGFHLDSSVLDQVYGGLDNDHALAAQAAKETTGQVLTYESKRIQAFFHSSCGGETASSQEGWGFALPYLQTTTCGYCTREGPGPWTYKISKKAFEKAFGPHKGHGVTSVKMGSRTDSGRTLNLEVTFGKKKSEINLIDLRQRLGYSSFKSTLLERVEVTRKDVIFYGRGFGHGVGMCQWGANGMAKAGFLATDILSRYYPGTELRRIY